MSAPAGLSVDDIARWDAAAVRLVADAAARRADAAAAATAALRVALLDGRAVPGRWSGQAAGNATARLDLIAADLHLHCDAARAVAEAVARIAPRIDAVLDTDLDIENVVRAEAVDAELAEAVVSAAMLTAGGVLRRSPAPPEPPPLTSPGEVRSWWDSLGAAEREELLSGCPDRIGNLDGIPVDARDRANRESLCRDLESGVGDTRANAEMVSDGLWVNARRTGSPTYLMTYQPQRFGGQGRAAIAIGDPDTAAHTAVLVPGTGASVTSGWLSDDTDQSDLFNEISSATGDPAGVSVIAWMGYNSPDSLIDPRVGFTRLARDGGALLASDVDALRCTARPGAHLTVVGHSYGATTVADAAAASGMRADDIVLVGSPGSDLAHSAADFHLPTGGHVYVGAASTDPVTFLAGTRGEIPATGVPTGLAGLGPDPAADGFGSTRFRAEVPGLGVAVWEDHGRYFQPGTESLYSIADIAGGDGRLLAEHGMTALHRNSVLGRLASAIELPNWSNPLADPELVRPATGGHFHRTPDG